MEVLRRGSGGDAPGGVLMFSVGTFVMNIVDDVRRIFAEIFQNIDFAAFRPPFSGISALAEQPEGRPGSFPRRDFRPDFKPSVKKVALCDHAGGGVFGKFRLLPVAAARNEVRILHPFPACFKDQFSVFLVALF